MDDLTKTPAETTGGSVIADADSGKALPRRLYSKKELAATLGKSTRTIDSWMSQGIIPYFRIAHSVLFDTDEVLAQLRRNHHIGPRT